MGSSQDQRVAIQLPQDIQKLRQLPAGTTILLSGTVLTARDLTHQTMAEYWQNQKPLPFSLQNQVVFYAGPSPTPPGKIIGSIGPTTSKRMDPFMEMMFQQGMLASIGKGERDPQLATLHKQYQGIYLIAPGGIAALLAQKVQHAQCIAFPELGPQAVFQLTVHDFPLMIGIAANGEIYWKRNC